MDRVCQEGQGGAGVVRANCLKNHLHLTMPQAAGKNGYEADMSNTIGCGIGIG